MSTRAVTTVDFSFVDGVEGANCTTSLERELTSCTSKSANAATVSGVAILADALNTRDDLVGCAGIAVAVAVKKFVALALTDAERTLKNFALRTSARVSSDDDHGLGAD